MVTCFVGSRLRVPELKESWRSLIRNWKVMLSNIVPGTFDVCCEAQLEHYPFWGAIFLFLSTPPRQKHVFPALYPYSALLPWRSPSWFLTTHHQHYLCAPCYQKALLGSDWIPPFPCVCWCPARSRHLLNAWWVNEVIFLCVVCWLEPRESEKERQPGDKPSSKKEGKRMGKKKKIVSHGVSNWPPFLR